MHAHTHDDIVAALLVGKTSTRAPTSSDLATRVALPAASSCNAIASRLSSRDRAGAHSACTFSRCSFSAMPLALKPMMVMR
jgi:hypothetical protein